MRTRTEKKVKAYFDRLAQDYDARLPWDELTEHVYTELTWRHIEPYIPHEGLVLDAGGGTGKWALPLADRGLRVNRRRYLPRDALGSPEENRGEGARDSSFAHVG